DGSFKKLYSFTGTEGGFPRQIVAAKDGNLYGNTENVLYRFNLPARASLGPPPDVTSTKATLRGAIMPGYFPGFTVYFEYGLTADYGNTAVVAGLPPGNDPISVSATVTNLLPHMIYHYALAFYDGHDVTSTADATFTTQDTPPNARPDDVQV